MNPTTMNRRLPVAGVALAVLAALAVLPRPGAADDRAWLGIYTEPIAELPEIEAQAGGAAALRGATCGLRVTAVFPDSPAETGGLQLADIIVVVCGRPLTCPAESVQVVFKRELDGKSAGTACPMWIIRDGVTRETHLAGPSAPPAWEEHFWRAPQEVIDSLSSGASLDARVTKRQQVLELPVVLGLRPEARWPEPRANSAIYPPGRYAESDWGPLVWKLADRYGIRADTEDLLQRLARCHSTADPYRLECMIYVHRDPFRLESVARDLVSLYSSPQQDAGLIARSAALLAPRRPVAAPRALALPATARGSRALAEQSRAQVLEAFLDQVQAALGEARRGIDAAFAAISDEEREFVQAERWNLSDAFAGETYIHFDADRERFRKNQRLLEIATRVNYAALLEAASALARLSDPEWARAMGRELRRVFADSLSAEILFTRETKHGRILIGGTGRHWYRDLDAAFIFDLGGDDFYSSNGSNGWQVPAALCIDLAGNDAYESTRKGCQGAGCLGIGGLLDLEGDDEYVGLQWCQGTGYFGVGWLHDVAGNDTYRGRTFCQAVGLFGLGLLRDDAGADRYEGDCHVQGVGLAKGIGALIDGSGDDAYYAKGLYPTGYGDEGIFDAWSQGCGMGFRTLASGGLGLLSDGGGRDRMEAGNFSQGGGYYYGMGILSAQGDDDDVYIGSRYNQGFCAHQAVGVFLEAGGDDFYTTRQGVAQGLAWDECVTLFSDAGGNDTYQGGSFFSQGASAHNSFCFFLDRAGRDRYEYETGPARAGGNDYHGGTSYSLFLDDGGTRDIYTSSAAANDTCCYAPEHGFFLDSQRLATHASRPRRMR